MLRCFRSILLVLASSGPVSVGNCLKIKQLWVFTAGLWSHESLSCQEMMNREMLYYCIRHDPVVSPKNEILLSITHPYVIPSYNRVSSHKASWATVNSIIYQLWCWYWKFFFIPCSKNPTVPLMIYMHKHRYYTLKQKVLSKNNHFSLSISVVSNPGPPTCTCMSPLWAPSSGNKRKFIQFISAL